MADPGFCTQLISQSFASAYSDADPLTIRHPDTGLFIGKLLESSVQAMSSILINALAGRDVNHHSLFSASQASPSISTSSGAKPANHNPEVTSSRTHYSNSSVMSPDVKLTYSMPNTVIQSEPGHLHGETEGSADELTAMSHTLLGQQFTEMDRVFTLNGTDFAFDVGAWDAMSYNRGG